MTPIARTMEPSAAGTGESPMVLLVRAAARTVAPALRHIHETLRPLPVEPLRTSLPYVVGVSIVRGEPLPVVDLGALLEPGSRSDGGRWVVVKGNPTSVVVAFDQIVGLQRMDRARMKHVPALLREFHTDLADALVIEDSRCVPLLDASRISGRIPSALELVPVTA